MWYSFCFYSRLGEHLLPLIFAPSQGMYFCVRMNMDSTWKPCRQEFLCQPVLSLVDLAHQNRAHLWLVYKLNMILKVLCLSWSLSASVTLKSKLECPSFQASSVLEQDKPRGPKYWALLFIALIFVAFMLIFFNPCYSSLWRFLVYIKQSSNGFSIQLFFPEITCFLYLCLSK